MSHDRQGNGWNELCRIVLHARRYSRVGRVGTPRAVGMPSSTSERAEVIATQIYRGHGYDGAPGTGLRSWVAQMLWQNRCAFPQSCNLRHSKTPSCGSPARTLRWLAPAAEE